MKSDQWFAVQRVKGSSTVYLVTGGDRCQVKAWAKSLYRAPTILKLTWGMMTELTGCNIPGDKQSSDFCRGQFMLPNRRKLDLVITAL